jgi:hypothetical protein
VYVKVAGVPSRFYARIARYIDWSAAGFWPIGVDIKAVGASTSFRRREGILYECLQSTVAEPPVLEPITFLLDNPD